MVRPPGGRVNGLTLHMLLMCYVMDVLTGAVAELVCRQQPLCESQPMTTLGKRRGSIVTSMRLQGW